MSHSTHVGFNLPPCSALRLFDACEDPCSRYLCSLALGVGHIVSFTAATKPRNRFDFGLTLLASSVVGVGHRFTASARFMLCVDPVLLTRRFCSFQIASGCSVSCVVGVGHRLTASGKLRLCLLLGVCCVDLRSMWSLAVGVGHDDDSFSEMIGTQSGC